MNRLAHVTHRIRSLGFHAVLLGVMMAVGVPLAAQEPTLDWSGEDSTGQPVAIPDKELPTAVVFVMAGQERSLDALRQAMAAAVPDDADAEPDSKVIAVVSGRNAGDKADALADSLESPPPIVSDPEYALSGAMQVRVWPTTVVVSPGGEEAAHIGGLTPSYAKDLRAYLDFAAGRIERDALDQRLEQHELVASTPAQIAARRLRMAQGLLNRGQPELALQELEAAHAAAPDDATINIAYSEARLAVSQPDAALALLDQIQPQAIPDWRRHAARGEALAQLGRWEDAIKPLTDALPLNPAPARSHYLLARAYERTGREVKAAEHYRAAFEHTTEGKTMIRRLRGNDQEQQP